MNADLFGAARRAARGASKPGTAGEGLDHALDQYFTPTWAAEWLVEAFFPDLTPGDFVVDAGCGRGAFLSAIPHAVPAIGVEIDPKIACAAQMNALRPVLVGDFVTMDLPDQPSLIIGNPPFKEAILDAMLGRAHAVLRPHGRVGWVMPAYVFQTPSRVLRMAEKWSLSHKAMLPRTLYRGLKLPLAFVVFTKDGKRQMQGFALYAEVDGVKAVPEEYQRILNKAPRSAWVRCVAEAMRRLGGSATVAQVYTEIGGNRPSDTAWWREKVRQVLQRHFERTDAGMYRIPA